MYKQFGFFSDNSLVSLELDIKRTRAIYLGLVVPDLGYTLYV